jgi:hypothetical protein
MNYYVKLVLLVFSALISASIPMTVIYLSADPSRMGIGTHLVLGIPCSWMLLKNIERKSPMEITSIVIPVGYVALIVTALLSPLGFGPLFEGL